MLWGMRVIELAKKADYYSRMNENILQREWSERRKTGEGCVIHLLASESTRRLRGLGKEVPDSVILRAFSQPEAEVGKVFPPSSGIQMERSRNPLEAYRVNLIVEGKWRVQVTGPGEALGAVGSTFEPPSVATLYLPDDNDWVLHDPGSGEPSLITVGIGILRRDGGGEAKHFAYIRSEVCHSYGEKWNQKPDHHAEVHYYETGQIRQRSHYHKGMMFSPEPGTPCLETFWAKGEPQIVEFGDQQRGRHRRSSEGPAYAEFFPNGVAAMEIFAELGKRGRGKVVGWVCRLSDGIERTSKDADLQLVSDNSLVGHSPPHKRMGTGTAEADFTGRHGSGDDWNCARMTVMPKPSAADNLPAAARGGAGLL